QVYDVQPNPIPDMFLGGQVVVTGRYKAGGATNVKLTGAVNGQSTTSTYQNIQFIQTSADSKSYSYVARLWAQRKVDSLGRQLALQGPDEATIQQVKDLGIKYSLVTPYTSFVVTGKTEPTPVAMQGQPGLPKTGLPFLYVDDYRTVNTLLMVFGGALALLGL